MKFLILVILFLSSLGAAQINIDEIKRNKDVISGSFSQDEKYLALQNNVHYWLKNSNNENALIELIEARQFIPEYASQINELITLLSKKYDFFDNRKLLELNTISGNKYHPIITNNGNKIYFCCYYKDEFVWSEDIFFSEKYGGLWSPPQPLKEMNSVLNEAPTFVNDREDKMIIFGTFRESVGGGDLYFVDVKRTMDSILRINYTQKLIPSPVNSIHFDGDGILWKDSVVVFASDRPNDIKFRDNPQYKIVKQDWGSTDIYISELKNGKWTEPINVGTNINTKLSERTPFLSDDGNILYFSSNGHLGLGGLDVFASVRLSNSSWADWSTPINLGPQINSASDDWGYKTSSNSLFASYSNNNDLFFITFNKEVKKENLVSNFTDNDFDSFMKKEKKTTPENNEGRIEETKPKIMVFDSTLNKFTLYFEFNNSKISSEEQKTLDSCITILQNLVENQDSLFLEVSGHSDSRGSSKYNINLSKKRATEVLKYIKMNGFNDTNITVIPYGETNPIDSNETDDGRRRNRRAEILIKNK